MLKTQTTKHTKRGKPNMILRIYTIRDNLALAYNRPFFERTDQTAKRALKQAIKQDENYREHTEDYALYSIGTFDDNTAAIESWPAVHLCNLIDLKDTDAFAPEDIGQARMAGPPQGDNPEQSREREDALHDKLRPLQRQMTVQGGE